MIPAPAISRARRAGRTHANGIVRMPDPADWTDHGAVISPGGAGAWDRHLAGQLSPSSIIKIGGTYYCYFCAGDAMLADNTSTQHKRLGVATSSDGITWTKSASNPIASFSPNAPSGTNNEEEGIFTAAAFFDGADVTLVHGGDTSISSTAVNGSVYLSTASDGVALTGADAATAPLLIAHNDGSFAGNISGEGDETEPVGLAKIDGTWWIWYYTKPGGANAAKNWDIYTVHSSSRTSFSGANSASFIVSATDNDQGGSVAGPVSIVRRSPSQWTAIYHAQNAAGTAAQLQARDLTVGDPSSRGPVIWRYDFAEPTIATVFLDAEAGLWVMLYQKDDQTDTSVAIHGKTAPVRYT